MADLDLCCPHDSVRTNNVTGINEGGNPDFKPTRWRIEALKGAHVNAFDNTRGGTWARLDYPVVVDGSLWAGVVGLGGQAFFVPLEEAGEVVAQEGAQGRSAGDGDGRVDLGGRDYHPDIVELVFDRLREVDQLDEADNAVDGDDSDAARQQDPGQICSVARAGSPMWGCSHAADGKS